MKASLLALTLFVLTISTTASSSDYEEAVELKLQAIDALSKPNRFREIIPIGEAESAKQFIEMGIPIPDKLRETEAIIPRVSTESALAFVIRGLPPGSREITWGDDNGPKFTNSYTGGYGNSDAGTVKSGPSEAEKSRWALESGKCRGDISSYLDSDSEEAKNCFVRLSRLMDMVEPPSENSMTFLKSIGMVSSITDISYTHRCMASIYKKDVWITARHCLESTTITDGIYIIIDGKKNKIKESSVRRCGTNCDIAFIDMSTPAQITPPKIDMNTSDLSWDTEIFVPGIQDGTSLASNASPSDYKYNLMWSRVGAGYCRSYEIDERGCLIHTCSTLSGFSGAPIYVYDEKSKNVSLIAIHSGAKADGNNCVVKEKANYARITTKKGVPL
ncbi:trypsin-like serine protease [Pseudomonas cucumis]|uniref:Serine protease n=1 Tax=Pseudomonas cucumis TaxID=2954082 RepID=A0ABY9ER64_9PSED|nr:trypsin-like serine protease [Pseudomonas cucumis]WLG82750.1 trypsin-like serine protease [Pseudomonas cucumis]